MSSVLIRFILYYNIHMYIIYILYAKNSPNCEHERKSGSSSEIEIFCIEKSYQNYQTTKSPKPVESKTLIFWYIIN